MQVRYVGYRVRGLVGAADLALYWSMIGKSAEERYKIVAFWERHGLAAAQEAFGVKSRRTLYTWRSGLRRGGGQLVLRPKSTRPHRLRKRCWPEAVVEEIRRLRRASQPREGETPPLPSTLLPQA